MTGQVWSFSEDERLASEAASAAAEVAIKIPAEPVVVEFGEPRPGVEGPGARLVVRGVQRGVTPEVASEAIARAVRALSPLVILIGGSRNGRETAARLAAKLRTGCVSEATHLSVEGESLSAVRSVYAGKATARLTCPFPAVATVKAGAYSMVQAPPGETRDYSPGDVKHSVTVTGTSAKTAGAVDLKSAKVIVSAGRGVKKKEDLALLEGLAGDLKGALGCSRPLSSDLGWLPEEHHIGLTGVNVKPELYLAVGISGQLQHVAGIKDSKVIAAINTDKDAPIFQASDYGVVGDLYAVVPALRKLLAERR